MYYNTSRTQHNGIFYCTYCGKECKEEHKYGGNHGRDIDGTYYLCDCEGAVDEIRLAKYKAGLTSIMDGKLHDEMQPLEKEHNENFPSKSYDEMNKIFYKLDLKKLKNKYWIT